MTPKGTASHHAAALQSRRGTIYVLVLSIAGLLAAISVGAGAYTSAETRRTREAEASGVARAAAQSAIEATVGMIQADPTGADWKPLAELADFAATRSLGNAAVSVGIASSDGTTPLTEWTESVHIDAFARHGGWQHGLRATLEPVVTNLEALGHPIVVGGNLRVNGTSLTGEGIAVTNGVIQASSADIHIGTLASGTTGSTFHVAPTIRPEPMTLPDSSVISLYLARATIIEISQLTGNRLEKVVLSSGSNPFGSTNASGIYAVRCDGQHLRISDLRVHGTLILIEPGHNTIITGHVFFEQRATNQPVFLVDGSISIETDSYDFSEEDQGINLNPTGSPFRGVTDTDTTDFYPSVFEGIVYVSGDVESSDLTTIEGSLIVGGNMTITGPMSVRPFTPDAPVDGMTGVARWRLLGLERITQ
jgi:hypothetical protein